MDEELVDPSSTSYTEIFYRVLPEYLSLGMSADEFWNGDVRLCESYIEAYKIRFERENHNAWLHGLYIYEALCDASPLFHDLAKRGTKAHPYSKEPYKAPKKETPEERRKRIFDSMMAWVRESEEKNGRRTS